MSIVLSYFTALVLLTSSWVAVLSFPLNQPTRSTSQSFWNDPELVSSLPDPPSDELLHRIQKKPYRGGFEPATESDQPYSPRIVHGSIPKDLVGTLATNGPGRIRIGEHQYGHWFDGDGFVTSLALNGREGRATFHARYVSTNRYRVQRELMGRLGEERRRNPPFACSGPWSLAGSGRWYENLFRIPTNPANTATMWLPPMDGETGHRLYALCEGGSPIELNPRTLETIGGERGFSSPDGKHTVLSFFSAHFSHCAYSGDIYNHGYVLRPGPLQNKINVMKLNKEGNLLRQELAPLPFDTFVHDLAISQSLLVYFIQPYFIPNEALMTFLTGRLPLGKSFKWDASRKSLLHVHSKSDLKLKWAVELPGATSMYHFVDADEMDTDNDSETLLAIRLLAHEPLERKVLERQFSDQYRVDSPRVVPNLVEYVFSLKPDGGSSLVSSKRVAEDAAKGEYAVCNDTFKVGRRRRFCWTNAMSSKSTEWIDGIQKVDMERRTALKVVTFGKGAYAGGPIFVPREGAKTEDDGFIVATVYCSFDHSSDVVVLDARTMKILCRLELQQHVPYQFHGDFLKEVTFGELS